MEKNDYCVVLTTFAKQEDASVLVDSLLKQQLAACIQCFPIQSFFVWNGEVTNDAEVLMLIKTRKDLYSEVESLVKSNHNYDLPEIIQIPITNGSYDYLNWIDKIVNKD